MITSSQKAIKALALTLVFSVLHLSSVTSAAQGATGKLTTRGNQPITVNGISTNSGDTILSGASIETGDQVGATINLGTLGTVEVAPNTKFQLTFSRNGMIEITLSEGCVILRVKEGVYGVIQTPGGKTASNDSLKKQAAVLDICLPKGAPEAIVNQGAAANAGAGAGGITGGTIAAEGLSGAVVGTLIAGAAGLGIFAVVLSNRGENTSPSS